MLCLKQTRHHHIGISAVEGQLPETVEGLGAHLRSLLLAGADSLHALKGGIWPTEWQFLYKNAKKAISVAFFHDFFADFLVRGEAALAADLITA